jgi:hypothetical protein
MNANREFAVPNPTSPQLVAIAPFIEENVTGVQPTVSVAASVV